MGHRGDEELIHCQINLSGLNNNKLNLPYDILQYQDVNWLIFSDFHQDFYLELLDYDLLGIGMINSKNNIINQNLFEILNPGLWINQNQVKIIANKELKQVN